MQGSSLAGAMPCLLGARRWTLCHLWTTQGSVQAWARLRDTPRPIPAGQGQSGGFSAPAQRTEGTANTAISAGPQRRSPSQQWSQLGNWTPWALGTGPVARLQCCSLLCACPQADLGLPSRGQGPGPSQASASAHQLFPRPRAGGGPALFALSQSGLCVPDSRTSRGREGIREVDREVEAGRGSRCKPGGAGGWG